MGFTSRLFKPMALLLTMLFFVTNTSTLNASEKILVWGDSLSAAYGIPVEKGWVSLMRAELVKLNKSIDVVNGSVSGETTQGGLTRLASALEKHKPTMVLLELGANDGLRGMSPRVTRNNLKAMLNQISNSKAKVILFGMKIPPNYGIAYSTKFESIFSDLSNEYKIPFIPFFLESIAQNFDYLQEDELHPTAEAQPLLLKVVLPTVKQHLK